MGSKKRNKIVDETFNDINHIVQNPRLIKKHAAHIRPVGQAIGNETGVHSKRPDAKPVYAKDGRKKMRNASQRLKANKSPYSSEHYKAGTKRNFVDRREKLLKGMNESVSNVVPAGTFILYKITDNPNDRSLSKGDKLIWGQKAANYKSDEITKNTKISHHVIKFIIYVTDSDQSLMNLGNPESYEYVGSPTNNGELIWSSDAGRYTHG